MIVDSDIQRLLINNENAEYAVAVVDSSSDQSIDLGQQIWLTSDVIGCDVIICCCRCHLVNIGRKYQLECCVVAMQRLAVDA